MVVKSRYEHKKKRAKKEKKKRAKKEKNNLSWTVYASTITDISSHHDAF